MAGALFVALYYPNTVITFFCCSIVKNCVKKTRGKMFFLVLVLIKVLVYDSHMKTHTFPTSCCEIYTILFQKRLTFLLPLFSVHFSFTLVITSFTLDVLCNHLLLNYDY